MNRLVKSLVSLTAIALLCSACGSAADGSPVSAGSGPGRSERGVGKGDSAWAYGQQEIDQDLLVAVAVNSPKQMSPSLLIIRQIPGKKTCWSEQGADPVVIDPLLLNFDFTGHCSRATDSNGYGVRINGSDANSTHRLKVRKLSNDLVLTAESAQEQLVVGRAHGLTDGTFSKLQLEPEWRFTLRTYEGKPVGMIYLSKGALSPRAPVEEADTGSRPDDGSGSSSGEGGSSAGAGGSAGSEDCGSLTGAGQCSGDTLSYCSSGEVVELDCAAQGKTCGWSDSDSFYDCVAAPESGCGAVTTEGFCENDTLSYCESGEVREVDCSAAGMQCGYDTANGYYNCLAVQDSGCGGLTMEGECDGSIVRWCEGGEARSVDCAMQGETCGWNSSKNYYDCI